jgi:predicted dehydrogenase
VGIYPLVFLRWLLGRPVCWVSAITGNYFFREHQQNDMEDFGLVLLELEGGIAASVMVGRTGWRSHPMGGVNRVVLVGTKAMACVDAYRPRVEVWADEPPWLPPRPDPEDPMGFWRSTPSRLGLPPKRGWITPESDPPSLSDARYFLDCLEQGRSSAVDAVAGAAALEVLMAAYESAATGQAVRLSARTS